MTEEMIDPVDGEQVEETHAEMTVDERLARARDAALSIIDDLDAVLTVADVEQDEIPIDAETTLSYRGGSVKALGNGRVGGYLVMFGSEKQTDLYGEYFDKRTDFGALRTSPVLYQHGMDKTLGLRMIGDGKLTPDDVGVWIDAQLSMRDEYEREIYGMAAKGKLGWSSGTAAHLVVRDGTYIKQWLLGLDASLTPNPAEPRIKAVTVKSIRNEGAEMTTDEMNKLIDERLAAATKTQNSGGIAAPHIKRVTERGFSNDATKTFLHWVKTGDEVAAKAALQGQTDSEGGYLVPDDFYAGVIAKRNLASWVRQAPVQMFTTNRDRLLVPNEATSMTKFVVTAEEGAYDENEPTFGQVAIEIHKMTKLIKLSEEVEADNGANLDGFLTAALARAAAQAENYYFTVGNGTNMPQGVLAGATSSAITTAGAAAITSGEVVSLIGKLGSGYNVTSESGFLMQNATMWYLAGLTGDPFQFNLTPNGNGIKGYNAYVSDDMEALAATKKAVLFGNFNFYAVAEREGMVVSRNPYLYQANGQIGLFAKIRIGGAVLQSEAFYYMTQHA